MDEGKMSGNHLVSAAAFVEGGIQDACDDACSICLEVFCDDEPSTLTICKHEYHLQCILEWCQRSSQCPMCWQPLSLKDPSSQELLDGVEQERNIRMNPAPRNNTTIFYHPTLGDLELRHLPFDANDSEMEERIIQHLAAAAAMGRARHLARGEGQRSSSSSSSTQARPRYLVFSTHPDGQSTDSPGGPSPPFISIGEDAAELIALPNSPQADQLLSTPTTRISTGAEGTSSNNRPSEASPSSQDRAGPSDLEAFSESVKSRLSALSLRCKDSITKSTRGWKDRLFSRNSSSPDHPAEAIDQRPATGPQMMDHLEISENGRTTTSSSNSNDNSTHDPIEEHITGTSAGPSIIKHMPEASSSTSS